MYDNLKEKTNEIQDKAVDDTRMAAQPEHDDVWVTPRDTVKSAEVEARTVSEDAKIEAQNMVSDSRIEQRAGTPFKKAEI